MLDSKGKVLEEFLENIGATVANVPLQYLSHIPLNTSFVDVTAVGDSVVISNWKFLDIPSLSDHPFISFKIYAASALPAQSTVGREPTQPKPFPNPAFCSAEKYLSIFINAVRDLVPLCPSTMPSQATIEDFIASLLDRMKSSASQSKLPYHPPNTPGKMPWWNRTLWDLRDKMRCAYKRKIVSNSPSDHAAYSASKAEYQRKIRQSKTDNFKALCSGTDDSFDTLKNSPLVAQTRSLHLYVRTA